MSTAGTWYVFAVRTQTWSTPALKATSMLDTERGCWRQHPGGWCPQRPRYPCPQAACAVAVDLRQPAVVDPVAQLGIAREASSVAVVAIELVGDPVAVGVEVGSGSPESVAPPSSPLSSPVPPVPPPRSLRHPMQTHCRPGRVVDRVRAIADLHTGWALPSAPRRRKRHRSGAERNMVQVQVGGRENGTVRRRAAGTARNRVAPPGLGRGAHPRAAARLCVQGPARIATVRPTRPVRTGAGCRKRRASGRRHHGSVRSANTEPMGAQCMDLSSDSPSPGLACGGPAPDDDDDDAASVEDTSEPGSGDDGQGGGHGGGPVDRDGDGVPADEAAMTQIPGCRSATRTATADTDRSRLR